MRLKVTPYAAKVMNIHIIIASNYFSQNLADLYLTDGYTIYYRAWSRSRFLKSVSVLFILLICWFSKLVNRWHCILYVPHSYGRFGTIMKCCHYDELIVIEDGIALLSAQSFQKRHIFNLLREAECTAVVACEGHVIDSRYGLNIKVIPRVEVMKRMLKNCRTKSNLRILNPCALILDNGRWSSAQIQEIRKRVKTKFNFDSLVVLHPSRKRPVEGCVKLDEPVEIMWYQNEYKINRIITAFSTAALNIKALRPDMPIVFIYPDAHFHEDRILQLKSEIIDLTER